MKTNESSKTNRKRPLTEWIIMLMFFVLSAVLVLICLWSDRIKEITERYPAVYLVSAGIFFSLLVILISLLKVYYSYVIASKTARSESAKWYYDKRYNTDQHNTFIEKRTRKDLVYRDDHEENLSRQHRRWILWVVLAAALCMSLLISIIFQAFPLFLIFGFITIIIFMYADYFPANRQFYMDYGRVQNFIIDREPSPEESKAIFYMAEYEETGFDINHPKYKNKFRNLFTIRKDVQEAVDRNKNHKIEKLPDLDLGPLEIRHIYKMCFDRIRNGQLVINIVLTLILLLVIGLDFSSYSSYLNRYFMLTQRMKFILTVTAITGVFIASILQILRMAMTEGIIAEISYKSRYVVDERLNDLFVEDLLDKRGIIKPIDIARGIYQTQGYVMTADENGRVWGKTRVLKWYNRPLFHHQEFSNRRRLVITVYLGLGIGISILWMLGQWLFVPLITLLAAVVHFLMQKYVLPNIGKDTLIKQIIQLENLTPPS